MTREIKFRVWDGDQQCFVYSIGLSANGVAYKWYSPSECIRFTEKPLQYTGLKDKNGTEIYEGDILVTGSRTLKYMVKWNSHGLWEPFVGRSYEIPGNYLEVIGNKHENPELLESRE